MKIARVLSTTLAAAGLLAVLGWTGAADAVTDRLTLECRDRGNLTAKGTFEYTKDEQPLGTTVTLECAGSQHLRDQLPPENVQMFVQRPDGANDFHIQVTVCETEGTETECNECFLDGVIKPREIPRAILECRLDPDERSPRAFFKLNR